MTAGMTEIVDPGGALRACRIAHHVPGRFRVKLAGDLEGRPGEAEAVALLDRLRALPGVGALTLNTLARSCTVAYARAVIPPPAWDDLLSGRDTGAAAALLARFRGPGADMA